MGNMLRRHADASRGYKSGRNSNREIPVSRSIGSTNSAGTPRFERTSQYQTCDCVVPIRSARRFWPPALSQASRSASLQVGNAALDMSTQYPNLGKLQPKNMLGTTYQDFGKFHDMEHAPSRDFGRRIRERREELRLSQPDLARESGYSQSNISHFELGRLKRPERAAAALAKALFTTADWLLYGKGPRGTLPPVMTAGELVDTWPALDDTKKRQISEIVRKALGIDRAQK